MNYITLRKIIVRRMALLKNVYVWICMAICSVAMFQPCKVNAQLNTDQVMNIGRNAMYFEDYVLSIQYFNQVISMKPYLAEPYFYRSVAKLNLGDYKGAEEDCTLALERNPFIIDAYQVRGVARQTLHKYKDAIADYSAGLKQLPEHKYFLMNKAVCEVAVKDFDAAEETYGKLIKIFPKFSNAYLGRSQLYLAEKDTVAALADVDKSISLNKNEANAYVLRSEIKMRYNDDTKGALEDMDEAIELEPHYAGFFINRAFMKYKLDDYFGAMADYDYALSLEPTNVTAYYNRALLKMEVNENNKAIDDFSYVLKSDPGHVMARYNRASLYYKTGQYKKAIGDYDELLNTYPNFQMALYARSECKRLTGDIAGGEQDYNRSRELYKKNKTAGDPDMIAKSEDSATEENAVEDGTGFESEEAVKNKFNTLLMVENDNSVKPEYDNKTRGRVQDRNMKIDNEPMFVLSYYTQSNAVKENSYYMREVNEANASGLLQFVLQLTNREPHLYEDQIQKHFNSIEYYNGMLATSQPRSIDYLGRAIDFLMVKNPESAISDLNRAIALSEKFTLAYFVRATARCMQIEMGSVVKPDDNIVEDKISTGHEAMLKRRQETEAYAEVLADFDKVLEYSPKNVYALYNKGCVYLKNNNLTAAISSFTVAIAEKSDFGEAYYNRGLAYLQLGNKEKGISDLSKAGELGILPSYSVLKRMN